MPLMLGIIVVFLVVFSLIVVTWLVLQPWIAWSGLRAGLALIVAYAAGVLVQEALHGATWMAGVCLGASAVVAAWLSVRWCHATRQIVERQDHDLVLVGEGPATVGSRRSRQRPPFRPSRGGGLTRRLTKSNPCHP